MGATISSSAKAIRLFGVAVLVLLVVGRSVEAQSAASSDYDMDDDRLIEISNLEQLDAVRYDLDGNGIPDNSEDHTDYFHAFHNSASGLGCPANGCAGYELTRNLDFNDSDSYATGSLNRGWTKDEGDEGWLPIGSHFNRFNSTFQGNDHTISNLFIVRDADSVGLFGGIESAGSVHRLGLVEVDVSGRTTVGPLAGGNSGKIVACYASGTVSGTDRVGGLIGGNSDFHGMVIDSYADVSVSGTSAVGGLAGGNWNSILGSHATGNVSGTNTVGGLTGHNSGPIGTSYATGDVSGSFSVGGLVGDNNNGGVIVSSYAAGNVLGSNSAARVGGLVGENYRAIRGSYASGYVTGGTRVGGLVGANFSLSTIIASYAIGPVSGSGDVGGLLGYNSDRSVVIGSYAIGAVSGAYNIGGLVGGNDRSNGISNSYWNIETSSLEQGVGGGFISGTEGKSTSELQTPTSYSGIFRNWNTDIDDADGDSYETTGTDDPWDFGTADRYPALRADLDGDGEATSEEFGTQHKIGPPPSVIEVLPQPQVEGATPPADPMSCTNGKVVENPKDNPNLVSDCQVLLQERNTLAGSAKLNWSTDIPIARWQGIVVEGSPVRVVEIQLVGAALTGRIPPQLGELSALRVLSFRVNNLVGGIPPELSILSELRHLDLHGNTLLGGAIPPELGDLSKLEVLDLDATGAIGNIPPEFGKLSNLERLSLGQNHLSGSIPPRLAELQNLKSLSLGQNELTGAIPPELGNLTNLESLFLSRNRLTGNIPSHLGRLSNLRWLYLGGNELTGQIPQELANLWKLDGLGLNDNQLTGEIPTWLSSLSHMDSLRLSENQLTGPIPAGLGNLSRLTLLYLHKNQLTGAIPPELGNLSMLRDFKLDHNKLTGPIPQELGNMVSLEVLDLGHNDLTGVIPRSLGNFSSLQFLVLDNNRVEGNIPAELGNLAELQYVRLEDNQLTGTIPAELTRLSKLVQLNVTGNGLTGCVPWLLAQKLILDITHDGLPKCFPPVAEGGIFSIDASRLLDDDTQTIVAVGDAVSGKVMLDGATITYTHDGSESVTDSFTYTATDGIHSTIGTVTVAVSPVNDPPVAVGDTASVNEGDTLSLQVLRLLDNDTDAENHTLSLLSVGEAVNGEVSLDGATIIYKHDGSETTSDSFAYIVSDGDGTDTAEVTITVTPVNDSPIAVGDTGAVEEGETLSIQASALLDNDTDAENDTLTVTALGNTVNGTVSRQGTTISYSHDGSETTTGSFAYTVSDGTDTDTAIVTITVTPVNDPPNAVGDTGVVDEGDTLSFEASALLGNDTDAENDALSITAVGDAVNGTVSIDGTTIVYVHDGSETTTGSFSYTVSDGTRTDTTIAAVTVTSVNDAPIAVGDRGAVNEGETLSIQASTLLNNDTDMENDTLSVTSVGDAVNGKVSLDGTNIAYEHDGSETTSGSFSYTVSDGAATDTAEVTVTVSPVNDPPIAAGDSSAVEEGEKLSMEASALLDNDTDAEKDTLTVTRVGNAVSGKVMLDGATIIYTHDGSETTMGSFAYTVSDGSVTDTTEVSISVTPVNDPPVAVDDKGVVNEGESLSIEASSLLRNDTDAENDTLTVKGVGNAVNGIVSLDGATITYEHDGSETTSDSFVYTVSDGVETDTAEVTLTVFPVNDPPVAVDDKGAVNEGESLSIEVSSLLKNDTDAENDRLSITEVGDAVNGMVSLEGATINFTHDGSETTTGSFSYTVSDGKDSDTTTVAISVMPVEAGEKAALETEKPKADAAAPPTSGNVVAPATLQPSLGEVSETPSDDNRTNAVLILLIVLLVVSIAGVGAVIVVRRHNRA